MRRRGGFTLVEVMVALVVTGVVALLVYGALATAADTQERLAAGRSAVRAELAWRAILSDAVRNVRSGPDARGPTLLLDSSTDTRGRPTDRLVLITTGSTPPLTDDADWRVVVGVGPEGPFLEASPLGRRGSPRLVRAPAGFTGLDVQALGAGAAGWSDFWRAEGAMPRALRITFWTDEGPASPPLLLALPLGSGG